MSCRGCPCPSLLRAIMTASLRVQIPPQHGAWAFLAVPLILGLAISGVTWPGVVFAVTWVLAYPASYYLGRALAVRARRGGWSRIARRERSAAIPWMAAAGCGAVVLAVREPVLVVVGGGLALVWWVSVQLAVAGRERGFGNDLLLVGQSLVALPLLWFVTTGDPAVPASVWLAAGVCATYFVGSVIHVKSLIRESDDRRWHVADVGFHVLALAWGAVALVMLIPFGLALGRAVVMRPGLRPGVIGAVEIVVSAAVVAAVLIAVP